MLNRLHQKFLDIIIRWLTDEQKGPATHLSDYERMRHELRPADVVLVEGRGRVSEIIKKITLSSWTHSALYIGRLHDIEDDDLRNYIEYHCDCDPGNEPLIIESLLEAGTIVAPLRKYREYHLRVCRPTGLSHVDAEHVVHNAISCLTLDYNVRQLFDLARFMFPFYSLVPRRWRSSLFKHNTGAPTRMICSTMIAQAFHEVNFPILPLLVQEGEAKMSLLERNTKLFIPADFDYSPYFEIIKYPLFAMNELSIYRNLPWSKKGLLHNDGESEVIVNQRGKQPTALNQKRVKSTLANIFRFVFRKSSTNVR